MSTTNIILTGTPRGGTTLACHLLNKLPETIALHEPIVFGTLTERAVLESLDSFFEETRRTVHSRGVALSKQVDGRIPDNPYGARVGAGGLRESVVQVGEVAIGKPVDAGFLLAVKHNAAFTAILPAVSRRHPAYAVVRNPLAVLASWNSVNLPAQDGHSPVAEGLDPALQGALRALPDRIDRQLHLLGWFFEAYRRHLPPASILRYETIVATGGRALSVITPRAAEMAEPLANRNNNPLYRAGDLALLGERLMESAGAYWDFYTRTEVGDLLQEMLRGASGHPMPPSSST